MQGLVCPACADAIDDEGAVGPSARGRALVAHVRRSSDDKAQRLRSLLLDDYPPSLPAWGALRERPSAEP